MKTEENEMLQWFINCKPGCLEVYGKLPNRLGRADSAEELARVFESIGVDPKNDNIYCSSSVDDCDEYGWKPGSARKMVRRALEIISENA
jgi:hypothetical protein